MHLKTCFFLVLCLASVNPNISSTTATSKSDEKFTLNDWEGNSTRSYNFSRYEYSTTDEFYNFTFYRNSTSDYNYTVPTSMPYDWTNYTFTYRPYRTDRPPWRLNFTTSRPIWPYYSTRRPVSWPYTTRSPYWPYYTTRRPVSWPYTTRSPYWPYYTTRRPVSWPYTTRSPYWPYYTTRRPFRLSVELLAKLNLTLHK